MRHPDRRTLVKHEKYLRLRTLPRIMNECLLPDPHALNVFAALGAFVAPTPQTCAEQLPCPLVRFFLNGRVQPVRESDARTIMTIAFLFISICTVVTVREMFQFTSARARVPSSA